MAHDGQRSRILPSINEDEELTARTEDQYREFETDTECGADKYGMPQGHHELGFSSVSPDAGIFTTDFSATGIFFYHCPSNIILMQFMKKKIFFEILKIAL